MAGRVQTWIRRRRRIRRWRAQGHPTPPVHAFKQQVVLDHARRFGLRTLVETGTWRGDMVKAALFHFDRIVSIELGQTLAARAAARFGRFPHVEIVQGDSAKRLPHVLETLRAPALFWLDGHHSGGDTARGPVASPLRDEMDAILAHPVHGHVLLIDDARHLSGEDGYPTAGELVALVRARWPHAAIATDHDIVRVIPHVP